MSEGRTHYHGCWRYHKDCADLLVERIGWVTKDAEDAIRQHGVDDKAAEIIGELEALRWYVGVDDE